MRAPSIARPQLPAWLDLAQGISGLALVLFMWVHMFMVASILLGKDAMYWVSRMFEGEPLFGRPFPVLVSLAVLAVTAIFVLHALLAMRKLPSSYRQYRAFRQHQQSFGHADTALWWLQVVTGVLMMFVAFAHLYQMLVNPADIGPYASADRVWSAHWWPFYLVLLFSVELHAGVGLYRLAVKWGWFADASGHTPRRRLIRAKWALTTFFLLLGLATLAAYMLIGWQHRDAVGERYTPAAAVEHLP
jgi:fumarate reductase subunit C